MFQPIQDGFRRPFFTAIEIWRIEIGETEYSSHFNLPDPVNIFYMAIETGQF